ncbi:flavodoxin domain-containing protein [Caldilinea sp.]|jgi:menaquinone-dependent protoporphyrinogen oxidase|uniref:flavodoxin domain-containing protein n=1 Tax=Caldilinea sp. TaxID=2293560 RepID=UPI0021DBF107|nr:flavodoxin domain-containing protein [Caldilinea sp.]GIV73956.1 MAG: flavodoxin [Caldilinea sp.]
MPTQRLSRRRFLQAAGLTVAGTTLACSGLGYVATRTPGIEYPEITLQGGEPMNNRILVTYATRAGSTAEIAAAIAETLAARGYAVDVKPVKEKPSLDGYTAVVLGSAIRMGNWLPEAVDFVKANQAALNAIPVALFTVHMLNTGDDEASRAARAAYLKTIRPLLPDAGAVYFEGKMDFARLSFLDRFIARMVKAVEADNRDWDKIKLWANTLEV